MRTLVHATLLFIERARLSHAKAVRRICAFQLDAILMCAINNQLDITMIRIRSRPAAKIFLIERNEERKNAIFVRLDFGVRPMSNVHSSLFHIVARGLVYNYCFAFRRNFNVLFVVQRCESGHFPLHHTYAG